MRKFLPWFLLVSFVALSVILKADDEVIEEIVARVNNQIITRSEFLHSKDELRKEAAQQDPVNADKLVSEREKDVLRDLIDQELLGVYAKLEAEPFGDELLQREETRKRKERRLVWRRSFFLLVARSDYSVSDCDFICWISWR